MTYVKNRSHRFYKSDEYKFEVFGSNHHQLYVEVRSEERCGSECLELSVKHGGHIVIACCCFSAGGGSGGGGNLIKKTWNYECRSMQYHEESGSLAMASVFSMTMIPDTHLMQ